MWVQCHLEPVHCSSQLNLLFYCSKRWCVCICCRAWIFWDVPLFLNIFSVWEAALDFGIKNKFLCRLNSSKLLINRILQFMLNSNPLKSHHRMSTVKDHTERHGNNWNSITEMSQSSDRYHWNYLRSRDGTDGVWVDSIFPLVISFKCDQQDPVFGKK